MGATRQRNRCREDASPPVLAKLLIFTTSKTLITRWWNSWLTGKQVDKLTSKYVLDYLFR